MNLRSNEFVSRANHIFDRARELGVANYTLIIYDNKLKVIGWRMRGLKSANDNVAKS